METHARAGAGLSRVLAQGVSSASLDFPCRRAALGFVARVGRGLARHVEPYDGGGELDDDGVLRARRPAHRRGKDAGHEPPLSLPRSARAVSRPATAERVVTRTDGAAALPRRALRRDLAM